MNKELQDAIEDYWSAAYNEGKYDLTTDDGRAQDALNRINAEVGKLEARVEQLEAENALLKMQHEADAAAIGQMARKLTKA